MQTCKDHSRGNSLILDHLFFPFKQAQNLIEVSNEQNKNKRVKMSKWHLSKMRVIFRKQMLVVARYSSFRLYVKSKWKVPLVMFPVNELLWNIRVERWRVWQEVFEREKLASMLSAVLIKWNKLQARQKKKTQGVFSEWKWYYQLLCHQDSNIDLHSNLNTTIV